jgi:hypothetical protein
MEPSTPFHTHKAFLFSSSSHGKIKSRVAARMVQKLTLRWQAFMSWRDRTRVVMSERKLKDQRENASKAVMIVLMLALFLYASPKVYKQLPACKAMATSIATWCGGPRPSEQCRTLGEGTCTFFPCRGLATSTEKKM